MKYPLLPTCDRLEQEPIPAYGFRVLKFILETNVTATLTDEALDAAAYAVRHVQTFKVSKAPSAQTTDYTAEGITSDAALAKFVEVERILSAVIRDRARQDPSAASGASKPYKDGLAASPSAAVPLVPKPKPFTPSPVKLPEPVINF